MFLLLQADSDTEWKFACTRLRIMYFGEIGSMPAPFNILLIGSIASFIRKRCCKKKEGKGEDNGQKNLREDIESEKGDKYKV